MTAAVSVDDKPQQQGVLAMSVRHTSPLSRLCLRVIARYRDRAVAAGRHSNCRFAPTCSHFAEEAFQTRAFAVAVLLTVARILRCNPLANRRYADPVRRRRRFRPRPNAVPTFFAVLALSGFVVVMTAGIAEAVGVSGGCAVNVNGVNPSQMTKKHPLVVHKGESVHVNGRAPTTVTVGPRDPNLTIIHVTIIEGIFKVNSSGHPGHGPQWGGTQNVDNYLKYGVGLYKVTGSGDGGNWHCDGSGYVRLKDGSPLGKPIGEVALVLSILGAGGAAASARPGKPDDLAATDAPAPAPDTDSAAAGDDLVDDVVADKPEVTPDPVSNAVFGMGCLALVVAAAFIAAGASGANFGAAAVAAGGRARSGRIWVHGHAILGFISGLISGLGLTVLAQQFAIWPLTTLTAIVFPIVVGLICAIRAYLGRAFKVVRRG